MPAARSLLLLALLLQALLAAACTGEGGAYPTTAPATAPADRLRGVTLDARLPPAPAVLEELQERGASHLVLIPFGFQPAPDVPEIRHNPDARWYSESDAGIRALARQADSLGMDVIIKPHLWLGRHNAADAAHARIHFATEADWQRWEEQYRALILHYARLSEAVGAPVFCIGTELAGPARTRPAFWRRLIEEVRAVYGGRLTYAANWYDEYEDIPFWDALDYIGVQAYFPLHGGDDPTPERLRAGWEPHLKALHRLHRATGRPVLFTEIGYRSIGYAAAEPWRWPSRDEQASPDPDLQARLYEAFFERVWTQPWFAGAVVWKWHPTTDARHALDFTPQDKPAADVIARWFKSRAAPPAP